MAAGREQNMILPAPRVRTFILDTLHADRALPEPAEALAMRAEDWDEFSSLARIHRLGPLLHNRLTRNDLAAAIPQEVKEQLQASQRKHAMRSLSLYRELVAVTQMLDTGNIPSIALKGAFLARFAYPEPGLRPMRDLDLLLRPEQALQAFDLLKECGYRPLFDGLPEAYFADRNHLPPLKGPGGISIELHHRLIEPGPLRADAGEFENAMWARSMLETVGGVQIRFPCPEDMLLHLCIHATLDHRLDLGPLALADVAFLLGARQINWQDFLAAASGGNWQRCALPLLHLAQRHLGAKVPDEAIAALDGGEGDAAWLEPAEYLLFSDPGDHRLLDYDVQEILYSGKLSERFIRLIGAVFPPRSVIARHFPVSADSARAYLYYPRRWCRLVTGKLPPLLRARAGRNSSLRRLALHRCALNNWLQKKTASGETK